MSKVIEMHLVKGTMDNIVKVYLKCWKVSVIKIPRTEINNYGDKDCCNSGVYFLIGKTDDDEREFVYVGESRNVIKRLNEHIKKFNNNKEIPYWNTAIVVNSEEFDITSTKYLEWKFFELIKESGSYKLTTTITQKNINVKEAYKSIMDEFLLNAKLLISTLGYRLFEKIEIKNDSMIQYFNCSNSRGANAKGFQNEKGFVVLKGSCISNDCVPSFPKRIKGYYNLRNKLIENKIIVNGVFNKNYQFSSPSAAGSVVLGRAYVDDWKTTEGKKFSELKI